MIITCQTHEIVNWHPEDDFEAIVKAARVCYQSEPLNTKEEKEAFVKRLIKRGEMSPLEHSLLTVSFITNRGVTHELVRHRLASYSQESTRYCNYGVSRNMSIQSVKDDESIGSVTYIWDPYIKNEDRDMWLDGLRASEKEYLKLLRLGYKPQIARGCLPIDLKTQIVMSANYREWRHVFKLRCNRKTAHPHIRDLMTPVLYQVTRKLPSIFGDICEWVNDQADEQAKNNIPNDSVTIAEVSYFGDGIGNCRCMKCHASINKQDTYCRMCGRLITGHKYFKNEGFKDV